MISKYVCSGSFKRSCNYVLHKKEAEVLTANGVRSHNADLMSVDFESQRLLHVAKNNACFHGILSFHPSEKPDNAFIVQIAEAYLQTLGIVNTQYAIVRHHDKSHPHVHILANLVNNEGKVISDKWIGLRGKKAAQALTLKYGLIPAGEKKKIVNSPILLNKMEQVRNEIRQAITKEILHCSSLEQLQTAILSYDITMQCKYKRGTQQIEGVSFKKGDYSFKGSSIDRRFSFHGLQKIFHAIELKKRGKNSSTQTELSSHGRKDDLNFDFNENKKNDFKGNSNSKIAQNSDQSIFNNTENAVTALSDIWNLAISLPSDEATYFGHITEDKRKKKKNANKMRL